MAREVDVTETLAAASARWATLNEEAAAKEIACYRAAALAALREARANGGECASDEELELEEGAASGEDADEDEQAAAGGAEGGDAAGADADGDGGAAFFARRCACSRRRTQTHAAPDARARLFAALQS
jgi:hypothetical protein